MRHAEVRVSAKEDTSLDHGRRRKEMSRRREKESASKPCSILGPSIHASMSRSCRELASGLLLGRDLKIHGQTQSPKADNLQGSQGEHMSGRHSGNPESVPNGPYDVAAQAPPARGEALTVATEPELCEHIERPGVRRRSPQGREDDDQQSGRTLPT
jgi:hypothetical protein